MAVGDTITAARYNTIQARIANVVGVGAGAEGYGQGVNSSQVSTGTTVTATDMNELYDDIATARKHQTGALPAALAQVAVGDTIVDSNSVSYKGYAQYEAESILAANNALTAHPSQLSVTGGTSSTYNNPWNTTITHVALVEFTGYTVTNGDGSSTQISAANHARNFFNAGGAILWSASLASGGDAKNADWRALLSSCGTVAFQRENTTNGSITGSNGWIDGDPAYDETQSLWTKSASAYGNNLVEIKVQYTNSARFSMLTFYRDNEGGNPIVDEQVTRPLTSNFDVRRPNNTNGVTIPSPALSTFRFN